MISDTLSHKTSNRNNDVNIRRSIPWAFSVVVVILASISVHGQTLSRDLNVDLLMNQAGYVPNAAKFCITKGNAERNFDVIHIVSGRTVFSGSLKPNSGDFGDYLLGDFSSVAEAGRYYLKSDNLRSYPFSISDSTYQPVMDLIVRYFSLQRCGASTTGYLSPCHIDDGIRMDNGKHQDVSGGWHDASDLRKWVSATIYGMIGLGKTLELRPDQNREAIIEELLWGNQYFLKMQEPAGYIMNFVGGDVQKHSDSNRWTDNEIGPDGGELAMVKPTSGQSRADMLIFGANDDRVIRTDPAELKAQYHFVVAELLLSRLMKSKDGEYAERCLNAAMRCYNWCDKSAGKNNPGVLGASMHAAIELYKTTQNQEYKAFAIEQAEALKTLQAKNSEGAVSGFYFTSLSRSEPYKNIWNGCEEIFALSDMITLFPSEKDAPAWKEMIAGYTRNYLLTIAQKNTFGIVPFGLFTQADPGGNKKIGDYWYRYFMQPGRDWWVGINANLASSGIGLLKA
ncbi:MAG: glycoside hydrolase family 9 protein, partial [Candidatus Hinthialibacter sp.]